MSLTYQAPHPVAPQGAKRSLEIDFIRGLALLAIAIDHIPSSFLSHAMLHTWAYCDSAEVFVFVSGYVCAAAWHAIAERRGEAAAKRRFWKRSREIYGAYLLTAVLMLSCGAFAALVGIDSPLVGDSGWQRLLAHPFEMAANIAVLRDQPYLAGVLPLYVVLAASVPVVLPFVRRRPDLALVASFGLWFASSWLVQYLPHVSDDTWAFNPFAWQVMFVLGMLCRLHPLAREFQISPAGRALTVIALALAIGFAAMRLSIEAEPLPGYLKQNLASVRIVSFAALAWLVAQAVRAGWVAPLARRLPAVVTVGQQGLVCFVGGACASNTIDMGLRATHATAFVPARIAGDALAIGALLALAAFARYVKRGRQSDGSSRTSVVGTDPKRSLSA